MKLPAFRQHVLELAFGINVFDVDIWVQIDSVKQPIERNSVGSGHVSQCRTSAFNNPASLSSKNVKQGAKVRRFCVCGNVIHIE